MSTHRTRPVAGHHYDGTERIVHPDGRPSCRWCQGPVPKPRRTFCGAACVHRWKVRTNPGYLRKLVWARDRGICAACGVDSASWYRGLKRRIARQMKAAGLVRARSGPSCELVLKIERAAYRAAGLTADRSTFWDADHIVPVVEGGGECDLDNLRTLCLRCHKEATRRLAERLAAARRAAPGRGTTGPGVSIEGDVPPPTPTRTTTPPG